MEKILILINVRWWNATAFYAINTARILNKNGYNVIIGSKNGSPPYKRAAEYKLHLTDLNFEGFNFFKLIKNFIKMLKIIKENNISIINAHRSEDHTFAALAKLFVPVKFIITRGDRRKIKTNIFSKMIYNSADKIILTCKSIYNQNKKFLSPFKDKIYIMHGSADEEHFKITKSKAKTARKYKINRRNKIIGIAGRLDYVKDQYTFVKAAGEVYKKFKKVEFIIAGKQEHIKVEELKSLAQECGVLHKIKILPLINDIADVVNLFDIAIISSVGSETISRVVLEYLYLGKPVIGTNVNVIPEIVKNNFNGIIIPPKKPKILANVIIKLLKNPLLLEKMAKNSKIRYNKYFSEKVFYEQLKRILLQ